MKALTASQKDALEYLYGGGDETIECHSANWVKTRFPQKCLSLLHKGKMTPPAGALMILERAKVDGKFGSCYTCEVCIQAAQEEF